MSRNSFSCAQLFQLLVLMSFTWLLLTLIYDHSRTENQRTIFNPDTSFPSYGVTKARTQTVLENQETLSLTLKSRWHTRNSWEMTTECQTFMHHIMPNNTMVPTTRVPDVQYTIKCKNCGQFVWERGYIFTGPVSEEERNYPLAFIITAHKNSEQVERLLRAIYRPQNVYCIHYDTKSDLGFQKALYSIANCFHNVFIASKLELVVYASFSRLKADMNCMHDLIRSPVRWRYIVNIAGQEFPLKTNRFMVDFLKNMTSTGHNGITSIQPQDDKRYRRFKWVFELPNNNTKVKPGNLLTPVLTDIPKSPPPENVTIYSGSAYNYFSRDFVNFTLNDPLARSLLTWMNDTYSPDENYWATLIRLPSAPGYYNKDRWAPRYRATKWKELSERHPPCEGFYQRGSCVYGVGDLPWLMNQPHLLANKFDIAVDEQVIDCLERWLIEQDGRDVSSPFANA